jgi:prepilin peptidase CpaA
MTLPPAPIQFALLALVTAAALFDVLVRRIPNWLTVAGAACGVALNVVVSGWSGLWSAAAGLGLALLIYVPLFLLRAVGGGDVKLMGAVGALVGPKNWLVLFLLASMLGGALALLLVIWKGRLARTMQNVWSIFRDVAHLRLPYERNPELDATSGAGVTLAHGAVIALGTLAYLILVRAYID